MNLQPWHIIIVVVIALLLFGGKRLPEAARGLGRSMRILKAEVGAMSDEKKGDDVTEGTVAPPTVVVNPTPLPPAAAPVAPVAPQPMPPVVQPIPPVQPIQAAQITINGRPLDSSGH